MRGGILLTPGDPEVKSHTRYETPDQWWHEEFSEGCDLSMDCMFDICSEVLR